MLKAFLAALILIGAGVFAMSFNVIFRKKEFPNSDVGSNENMRRMGIRCMKDVDADLFSNGKKPADATCSGTYSESCAGCGLYPFEKKEK